jgi:hypothetical protein
LIERAVPKSLLVPRASVVAEMREMRISMISGPPSYIFADYIPLETSGEMPFKRIRTLTVDEVIKESKMDSMETEAVITVVKKNGETVKDTLNSCYKLFCLTNKGLIRPALSSITRITFDSAGS